MGNKKIPLYPVMLITGIAVTIFSLSLLGIAVITAYLPIAQPDTPAVRDSASDPQHPSRSGTTTRAVRAASLSDPVR